MKGFDEEGGGANEGRCLASALIGAVRLRPVSYFARYSWMAGHMRAASA